jgi:hypothetical protein
VPRKISPRSSTVSDVKLVEIKKSALSLGSIATRASRSA